MLFGPGSLWQNHTCTLVGHIQRSGVYQNLFLLYLSMLPV